MSTWECGIGVTFCGGPMTVNFPPCFWKGLERWTGQSLREGTLNSIYSVFSVTRSNCEHHTKCQKLTFLTYTPNVCFRFLTSYEIEMFKV